MYWESVDERLIRRGELLLSLEFLDGYEDELNAMNRGKVGRPYALADRYRSFYRLFATSSSRLTGSLRASLRR